MILFCFQVTDFIYHSQQLEFESQVLVSYEKRSLQSCCIKDIIL